MPGTVVDRYGALLSRWESCKGWGQASGGDPAAALLPSDPPTVVVKIVDACPCVHDNYASNQRWCCGDQPHIDLGASAFDHLADKHKGVVRVRWLAVDCGEAGNGPVAASSVAPS